MHILTHMTAYFVAILLTPKPHPCCTPVSRPLPSPALFNVFTPVRQQTWQKCKRVGEWCYTISIMAKDVSFVLDTRGGQDILTKIVAPDIKARGQAIQARAQSMAQSMSKTPPEITMTTAPGTIKRGVRAIATIRVVGRDAHANYIGYQALLKARDAGRG